MKTRTVKKLTLCGSILVLMLPGLLYSGSKQNNQQRKDEQHSATPSVVAVEEGKLESCMPVGQSNNPLLAARLRGQVHISEYKHGVTIQGGSRLVTGNSMRNGQQNQYTEDFNTSARSSTQGKMKTRVVEEWSNEQEACIILEYRY